MAKPQKKVEPYRSMGDFRRTSETHGQSGAECSMSSARPNKPS
jgi:hypothetical protein